MGKGQENKGAQSKQDSTPVQIVEPESTASSSTACSGDVKLQQQKERELREAKEEDERKRAKAEKEKQDRKNAETNKPRSQKSKPQNKSFSEPNKTINSSGEWNIDSADNSENDKVLDKSYQEPTQQRIKNSRDNTYETTGSENSPTKLQNPLHQHNETSNWDDSSPDDTQILANKDHQSREPRRSNDNWLRNDRAQAPNYNTRDYYSKFSNRGPGANYQQNTRFLYDGRDDEKFQEFLDLSSQSEKINHNKIQEIKGDLFTASEEYSLAHCVAEDMFMGAGIAKTFRAKFGQVGLLLNQRRKTGGLAILEDKTRYIYYLVTKPISRGKPTYYTLWQSLLKMRDHIFENGVNKLALPQIGCGLDRLEWFTVSQMLEHVFKDIEIEIMVYIWDETWNCNNQRSSSDDLVLGVG